MSPVPDTCTSNRSSPATRYNVNSKNVQHCSSAAASSAIFPANPAGNATAGAAPTGRDRTVDHRQCLPEPLDERVDLGRSLRQEFR